MVYKPVGITTDTSLFPPRVMTALKNIFAAQLGMLPTTSTAAAPTVGSIQSYNASAGNIVVTLPSLLNLVPGNSVVGVQKSSADPSSNTITVTTGNGDSFDSGAATLVLKATGEVRTLQVVTINGTKYWKVVSGNTPLSYFDRYQPILSLSTSARNALTGMSSGYEVWDSTLKKPVWFDTGTTWRDATGTSV